MRNFVKHLRRPVFLVDSWTLQDFYNELVKSRYEEIFYATGVHLDNLRVISRLCPLVYEKQSSVYVRATRKSSADALIEICEHDNQLHLVAHSHPGKGAYATTPSWTDIEFQHKLEKTGAEAIALIVSRDGYLRFWSVKLPFKIIVRGNGISEVKGHNHVYHFETSQTGEEPRCKIPRQELLCV